MRNTVSYEWDYERTDEHGDILDHNHADRLSQFAIEDITDSLVLVRDLGNENEGLQERTFAYVKDNKLPEYFTDGAGNPIHKVPKRFNEELKTYLNKP